MAFCAGASGRRAAECGRRYLAIFGVVAMVRGNQGGQTDSAPPPVHSPLALPAAPPSMPHAVRSADDELVAIAISPPPAVLPKAASHSGHAGGCRGVPRLHWRRGRCRQQRTRLVVLIATLRATAGGRLGGSANSFTRSAPIRLASFARRSLSLRRHRRHRLDRRSRTQRPSAKHVTPQARVRLCDQRISARLPLVR